MHVLLPPFWVFRPQALLHDSCLHLIYLEINLGMDRVFIPPLLGRMICCDVCSLLLQFDLMHSLIHIFMIAEAGVFKGSTKMMDFHKIFVLYCLPSYLFLRDHRIL